MPLRCDPADYLHAAIVHHSIQYAIGNLPAFRLAPQMLWRLAYLAFIGAPLSVVRPPRRRHAFRITGGVLVAALFAVSYFVFWYAFTSVWCFFAAVLSLLLAHYFYKLPRRAPARVRGRS